MKFYLTNRAEEEIEKLAKKAPTKNVREDICMFFKDLGTIDRIRTIDQTLGNKGKNTTRKKSRMKNSINNEKDGGYRIYFMVSEQNEVIVIASIYSKKIVENYSKEEIKEVYRTANDDLSCGAVYLVDINDHLKKIQPKEVKK